MPAEERILRATMAAMAELDPAALTIKQICLAAQVTAPTLYYHFGSKDGLVAAAVERLVADWLAQMNAVVSREGSLDDVIGQAVDAWIDTVESPRRPLAVFAWTALLLGTSELPREALIKARDQGRALIADVVGLHLAPPALVDMVTGLIVDTVIASAVQYELDRDPAALRAQFDALATAVRMTAAHLPAAAD